MSTDSTTQPSTSSVAAANKAEWFPKATELVDKQPAIADVFLDCIDTTDVVNDMRVSNDLSKTNLKSVTLFLLLYNENDGLFNQFNPKSLPHGARKVGTLMANVQTLLKSCHEKFRASSHPSDVISKGNSLYLALLKSKESDATKKKRKQELQDTMDGHEQQFGMQPRGRDGGNTSLNRTPPPRNPPTGMATTTTTTSTTRSNIAAAAVTASASSRRRRTTRATPPVPVFFDPICNQSEVSGRIADWMQSIIPRLTPAEQEASNLRQQITDLTTFARNAREFGMPEQARVYAARVMELQDRLTRLSNDNTAISPTAATTPHPPSPSSSSSDEDDEEREERELRMAEEGGMAGFDFFGGAGFG